MSEFLRRLFRQGPYCLPHPAQNISTGTDTEATAKFRPLLRA
jgi:hypothetical protein